MTAWQRSVMTGEAAADLVAAEYGLRSPSAVLLRSLGNDVYRVDDGDRRYAFKLYRTVHAVRARSVAEVAWEQDLAVALVAGGLAVPAPVARTGGELVGVLDAPEGPRPYALLEWLAGDHPALPYTDDLYRAFGVLTARFHTLARELRSPHPRRPVRRIDELPALAEAVAAALPDPGERALVLGRAASASAHLAGLGPLTAGIRHGDVSLDNLLVTRSATGSALALLDFDLATPGSVAADLTGVRATVHGDAFTQAYREHAQLSDADLAALPWLEVIERIVNLSFHLLEKPLVRGSESVTEGWVRHELDQLGQLPT